MASLAHLKPLIEAKSGAPTFQVAPDSIRARLGFHPDEMRRSGFDPSTIELHERFYETFESFMAHPLIGEYLTSLTPTQSYRASNIWVATLQQIRNTALGDGSPDWDLFRHGYISIAGSVGGNSVCLHNPSGRVIWADHERTSRIIEGDVQILSEDIDAFLTDLVHDRLERILDELD